MKTKLLGKTDQTTNIDLRCRKYVIEQIKRSPLLGDSENIFIGLLSSEYRVWMSVVQLIGKCKYVLCRIMFTKKVVLDRLNKTMKQLIFYFMTYIGPL